MTLKVCLITGFLSLCLVLNTKAQPPQGESPDFRFGGVVHAGFLIAHSAGMKHLPKGHIGAFEFSIARPSKGKHPWEHIFNFPETGVSFLQMYLSNPDQLGNALGIYPFIQFSFIRKHPDALRFKMGTGIGYISKIFNSVENNKNTAIGSHLNGLVNLRLSGAVNITKQLRIESGIGLFHFSNGGTKMPNLGINLPTLHLGASWRFADKKSISFRPERDSVPKDKIKYELLATAATGASQVAPIGGETYIIFSSTMNAYRLIGHKTKLGVGMDLFYNPANIELLRRNHVILSSNTENIQTGVHLGYALRISRLAVPIDFGYYLYTKNADQGIYYHRLGLRYQCNKFLVANVTLKTHWAKAEFFEFGLGWKIL